jgi:predicted transcriptional regulator
MTLKNTINEDFREILNVKFEEFEKRNAIQFNALFKHLEKSDLRIEELNKAIIVVDKSENGHILRCPNTNPIREMQLACKEYPSAIDVKVLIEKINDTESIKKYYKVFVLAFLATVIIAFIQTYSFMERYTGIENLVKTNTTIIQEWKKAEIKSMNR